MPDLESKHEDDLTTLARVSDDNPSPVLRVALDGSLVYANRGSWLVLQQWAIEVGETLPQPWLEIVQASVAHDETREETLSVGAVAILLVFVPAVSSGYVAVYGIDISKRKHMELKLELNAKVFEHASEGIVIMDEDLRVVDINPAYSAITGYLPEDILGEVAVFLSSSGRPEGMERDQQSEIWDSMRGCGRWEGEIWDRRKNGERYAQWLSLVAVHDNSNAATYYIGLLADISSAKEAEDQLYRMAHYDSLTHLPNRRLLHDRVRQAIVYADRSGESLAVMIVDLDNFKLINDSLGHYAGDHILRLTGERLQSCVRQSDTVARIGGDEFVILLRNMSSQNVVETIAQNVLKSIAEPTMVAGDEIFVTASIGIAVYPGGGGTIEDILRNADDAMYEIKKAGKNDARVSSAKAGERVQLQFMIQTRLRRGLDNQEFVVHYQPQFELVSGRLDGLEALARWQTTDLLELSTPDHFIPAAENCGLIHRLGQQVFSQVCAQAALWHGMGLSTGRIGINISARQLRRDDFVEVLKETISTHGVKPEWLELELTETVFIEEVGIVERKLELLRDLGVSLSIDDFGTKYASLAYLKRFNIDRLKIDQSFVQGIPENEEAAAIVEAILAMSERLGVAAIAEGVETAEQLQFLAVHGCNYAQGYFCSPAVDSIEVQAMLERGGCLEQVSSIGFGGRSAISSPREMGK